MGIVPCKDQADLRHNADPHTQQGRKKHGNRNQGEGKKSTRCQKITAKHSSHRIHGDGARSPGGFLVGDFNGWQAEGFQMRKFKDGICRKKVQLKPGRYEYLFLVDGDWRTDPRNEARCTNPFGRENSIIEICS